MSTPAPNAHADQEIITTRFLAASPETVFAAFGDPAQLVQWWGPHGFTSTIQAFDFRPGGRWHITLRDPQGTVYENEKQFLEIAENAKVVFRHQQAAHSFTMTMLFTSENHGTRLTWHMLFDSADECAAVRTVITSANEENLDRLATHLRKQNH